MEYQYDFLDILDKQNTNNLEPSSDTCPECGNEIVRNGRCKTCYYCGWSSCDL